MSDASRRRSDEFLAIADQFKLGVLVTESSHPVTGNLSDVAQRSAAEGLKTLFDVDGDVVRRYRDWAESDAPDRICGEVLHRLRNGGRVFFTGCGSTGRLSILLDSIWRRFWRNRGGEWGDRTVSLMAGGDFALIKAVEGFEDVTSFGRRQIAEQQVCERDVVFAITEGGETSWVIGTAWEALDRGAKVYFVYNNPDDVLREHVQRSREVLDEPGIEKVNLTTGPMAITGSTRMQATTVQLCVLLTVMEMAATALLGETNVNARAVAEVPARFLESVEHLHCSLQSSDFLEALAGFVEMEEAVYRNGRRANYFAGSLALDVLTDTTERSPTFCTPTFRRFDDNDAADSWVFLFTTPDRTEDAWEAMLGRAPRPVQWSREEISEMVPETEVDRRWNVVRRISLADIYKFKIGLEGVRYRPIRPGDAAVAIVTRGDSQIMAGFRDSISQEVTTGVICVGESTSTGSLIENSLHACLPVPHDGTLLRGACHVGTKMLLNALSTCIMVRLGRVMGNYMIYVVPSNLKLIDRATRYIAQLTGLSYDDANRLLFDVIEYVEPRMASDQAYPPVVGLAVTRHRYGLNSEEAERLLLEASGGSAGKTI